MGAPAGSLCGGLHKFICARKQLNCREYVHIFYNSKSLMPLFASYGLQTLANSDPWPFPSLCIGPFFRKNQYKPKKGATNVLQTCKTKHLQNKT